MAKKDRKRRYSYNEYRLSVYVEKSFLCDSVISFSFDYDDKLPIVLFVGQHFSGSLFKSMHLSILTRERTKETRCKSEPRLRKARALR